LIVGDLWIESYLRINAGEGIMYYISSIKL